ncbi:hypothetical protein Y032_0222g2611 [Ancylostoma ceylanicum]|nr:hypothetical protein Y032_0222g2611 [Ancylostoma ceylanicum]
MEGSIGWNQAITVQPGAFPAQADICMPVPVPIEGVPPGLECLSMVDRIKIKQLVEIVEVISGFETKNKYALKNASGQQVYYAFEESDCCERVCCGPNRGFTIHIVDNYGREVIRIRRAFRCCGKACFGLCGDVPGCGSVCKIESPPGRLIGKVEQRGAFCASSFVIKDQNDRVIFQIYGPLCCFMCGCHDKEFPVDTPSGDPFGSITKEWSGCGKEAFTDADLFSVSFPMSLDVRSKAILIGAAFLIDFMEFEQPGHIVND